MAADRLQFDDDGRCECRRESKIRCSVIMNGWFKI